MSIYYVPPNSNIDTLLTDYPTHNTFYFDAGSYYITKVLKITRPRVNFIGLQKASLVHIFQSDPNYDGIAVKTGGDYFTITNISVHVPHDNKIALTVAGCRNTTIQNNYWYGNATTFSIYYAGPNVAAGDPTINAYNTNALDAYNVFKYNVVYSKWSGDAVSYSLQINGKFSQNIIRGGKLAVYMCKRTTISNNYIYNSSSSGMYVSLPSHNVVISKNVIYECKDSAIKICNQTEHPNFTPSPYNINIVSNTLFDIDTIGIELNDCDTVTIKSNKLSSADVIGIYLLRSANINLDGNKMGYFHIAFDLELSTNSIIQNNILYSIYPNDTSFLIKLRTGSNNNSVINNVCSGKFSENPIYVTNDCVNNTFSGNIFNTYYDYDDEIKQFKIVL